MLNYLKNGHDTHLKKSLNIFAINENPWKAAKDLPDQLVVKMPSESCQMLAHWLYKYNEGRIQKKDGNFYGVNSHPNHPCTKWLFESDHNVKWLISHSLGLCKEYNLRFLKTHACKRATLQVLQSLGVSWVAMTNWKKHTTFPLAMPEVYKGEDRVLSYRKFMIGEKDYARWLHSEKPNWWK